MKIKKLNTRINLNQNKRLNKKYLEFKELITELRERDLNEEIVTTINNEIDSINSLSDSDNKFRKELKNNQSKILKLIEKELKLVTKNHYRNIWLAIGNGVFGVPIGVVIGVITGNMGFIGIGIAMGFAFGIAVGTMLDQKAKEKGNQLNFEIKY